MAKIKKGDQVLVIAGKERGKLGMVERVYPLKHKLLLTGMNIVKRHTKKSAKDPHGGIIDKPAPLDWSNVMLLDPTDHKPTRVAYAIKDNRDVQGGRKTKTRVSRRSGHELGKGTE